MWIVAKRCLNAQRRKAPLNARKKMKSSTRYVTQSIQCQYELRLDVLASFSSDHIANIIPERNWRCPEL